MSCTREHTPTHICLKIYSYEDKIIPVLLSFTPRRHIRVLIKHRAMKSGDAAPCILKLGTRWRSLVKKNLFLFRELNTIHPPHRLVTIVYYGSAVFLCIYTYTHTHTHTQSFSRNLKNWLWILITPMGAASDSKQRTCTCVTCAEIESATQRSAVNLSSRASYFLILQVIV
jgi:hypothetical protein